MQLGRKPKPSLAAQLGTGNVQLNAPVQNNPGNNVQPGGGASKESNASAGEQNAMNQGGMNQGGMMQQQVPEINPLADPCSVQIEEIVEAKLDSEGALQGEASLTGKFEVRNGLYDIEDFLNYGKDFVLRVYVRRKRRSKRRILLT